MKKKGFTLIELLAVIIVLAIIALVATPIVLNIIDDYREKAAKDSAYGVLHSANYYYAEEYMENNGSFSEYECSFNNGVGCDLLSISGDKPTSGSLSINKDGKVNGKVEFNAYEFYICNSKVLEEESSECSFIEYEKIYAINEEGIITGLKTEDNVSMLNNIIPTVYATNITSEASEYIKDGKITIPEYVNNIEVKGIADNAFSGYEIKEVTILSSKVITIGTNAFPTTLTKLRVNSCLVDSYDLEVAIEGFGPSCNTTLYVESILNGAYPELYTGLIPVTINSTTGEVKVADLYSPWYNYSNRLWANAVTVNDETYRTAEHGTTIPEDAISAYYVWIPRYKYKLFNVGNSSIEPQAIEIIFENNETDKSSGTANGEYLTHPGFTFGTKELNGMWVGKFETSGTTTALTIKPNQKPLGAISVASMFMASRNMEKAYNTYGFVSEEGTLNNNGTYTTTTNGIDTHMMKNMEWGAVAYLSHSNYGTCRNDVCTEIGFNNYSESGAAKTGCGEVAGTANSTTCNSYLNALASTNGNITGIYDMSGGGQDYVMAAERDSNNSIYVNSSGFPTQASGKPNDKYVDKYPYANTATTHSNGKIGDATKETLSTYGNKTGGWYGDSSQVPYNSVYNMWYTRGGNFSSTNNTGGIFAFGNYITTNSSTSAFHIVLTAE